MTATLDRKPCFIALVATVCFLNRLDFEAFLRFASIFRAEIFRFFGSVIFGSVFFDRRSTALCSSFWPWSLFLLRADVRLIIRVLAAILLGTGSCLRDTS